MRVCGTFDCYNKKTTPPKAFSELQMSCVALADE